jgi:hypothetical protein
MPSSRPTVTRGTVSFSGKALQPPVDYQRFIGNEGIGFVVTPTGNRRVMRVPIEMIHAKITEALSGNLHTIDVKGCSDLFTAGESYLGTCPGLVDRVEVSVGRFFADEYQRYSTGFITGIQQQGDDVSSLMHHRRACVITAPLHGASAACGALGLRCLYAGEEAMIGVLGGEGISSRIAYIADFSDCLPLSNVISWIHDELPDVIAACALVHIMKLVLRSLQKLVGRRVSHGHLDNINHWIVGVVSNGADTDIAMLPIGWDDVVDFRVFANSEVGNTIPVERPTSLPASTFGNEEDVSSSTLVHVGYDICHTIPAMLSRIGITRYLDQRAVVALQELTQWAEAGGHSPPEYSFKMTDVLGTLVPTVGDPKAAIPWHHLLSSTFIDAQQTY